MDYPYTDVEMTVITRKKLPKNYFGKQFEVCIPQDGENAAGLRLPANAIEAYRKANEQNFKEACSKREEYLPLSGIPYDEWETLRYEKQNEPIRCYSESSDKQFVGFKTRIVGSIIGEKDNEILEWYENKLSNLNPLSAEILIVGKRYNKRETAELGFREITDLEPDDK